MNIEVIGGILIPFVGTTLGAAGGFFMKKYLNAALHKLTVLLEFIISFVLAAGTNEMINSKLRRPGRNLFQSDHWCRADPYALSAQAFHCV